MTRRRLILSAAIFVVGLVAVAVYTAWPTPPLIPGVTKENFARISNGMTQRPRILMPLLVRQRTFDPMVGYRNACGS